MGFDQVDWVGGDGWGSFRPLWIRAEPCSGLSCRWLAQNGEWAFPLVTGLLCVLTVFSLVSLNFSDPGILHQGEALAPGRSRQPLLKGSFHLPSLGLRTLSLHILICPGPAFGTSLFKPRRCGKTHFWKFSSCLVWEGPGRPGRSQLFETTQFSLRPSHCTNSLKHQS